MEKSETIKELASALSKFQNQVPKIELDKEVEVQTKSGAKYKFKYATFSNILEKIRSPLSENGLSFSQLVNADGSVTTLLMHSSGEWLSSNLIITGEKTPQAIGSAITYNKRYSLTSILGICGDEDDDGNAAQGNQITFGKVQKNVSPPKNTDNRKIVPVEKMMNDDFLQALHDLDKKNKNSGITKSIHAILEQKYILTTDEIKKVCNALGEFEQRTHQIITQ